MTDNFGFDWENWEPVSPVNMTGVVAQLKIEVAAGHLIYHLLDNAEIFARDTASDDVLLSNPDNMSEVFVVHPTWSKSVETTTYYPRTIRVMTSTVPSNLLENFGR